MTKIGDILFAGDRKMLNFVVLTSAAIAIAYFFYIGFEPRNPIADAVTHVVSSVAPKVIAPDKRGWMDDAEFTEADRARVAEIGGQGQSSNLAVIRSMQTGARSAVTRRDFELMRQDVRRARAAYPTVSMDDLTYGAWVQVDLDAEVPMEWGGWNSNGTERNGKVYLDGGAYMGFVKPQYSKRASAAETKAYFAAFKEKMRQERIASLEKDGPFGWSGGSGGSLSVSLNKDREVEVVYAAEWSSEGTKWTFPFKAEEWVDTNQFDLDQIKRVPSFALAREEKIKVQPSGLTITNGTSP